jgi:hypothetical protein
MPKKEEAINELEERKASFQEGLGRLKLEGGGGEEEEAEDGSKQGMLVKKKQASVKHQRQQ